MSNVVKLGRVALVIACLGGLGCSSGSKDPGSGTPTSDGTGAYRGLLTGSSESGVLDIQIDGSGSTTGTLTLPGTGGTLTLTGSYSTTTKMLSLMGTTPTGTYAVNGTFSNDGFTGTYSGPHGMGSISLTFGSKADVTVYCGTYSGDASGNWNIVVGPRGGILGSHCASATGCGVLAGTISGSTITLSDPDVAASGMVDGSMLSGVWMAKVGAAHGTWTGSSGACQ
jgi:hypothetical protein